MWMRYVAQAHITQILQGDDWTLTSNDSKIDSPMIYTGISKLIHKSHKTETYFQIMP